MNAITLLNYRNDKVKTKDFPDLDTIENVIVMIHVVYGDEWIEVLDGTEKPLFGFKSDEAVWSGGYDGSYPIYERHGLRSKPDIDLINNPNWQARKDSYEFLWAG